MIIQSGKVDNMPAGRVQITGPFRTHEPVEVSCGPDGPVMTIPGGIDVPAGMTVTFEPAKETK